jgi:1-aminocyclopropane-1-carboxylate deaminase
MIFSPAQEMPIQKLNLPQFSQQVFIKRIDMVHPLISGNKYFKLWYPLQDYMAQDVPPQERCLISFGGAYSNHLVALAAAAKLLGVPSIGLVRGEELQDKSKQNPSLNYAQQQGMQLAFVSREAYRNKAELSQIYQAKYPKALIIPEGGSSPTALKGLGNMLDEASHDFDYICTAVGTGATYAGLRLKAEKHQQVIGFQMVKDPKVAPQIVQWTGQNPHLITAAGKYGKITPELLNFIQNFKTEQAIELDVIYTSRLMQSLFEALNQGFFPADARILVMHTGGLQANAPYQDVLI